MKMAQFHPSPRAMAAPIPLEDPVTIVFIRNGLWIEQPIRPTNETTAESSKKTAAKISCFMLREWFFHASETDASPV
jgi:hypothetical protein